MTNSKMNSLPSIVALTKKLISIHSTDNNKEQLQYVLQLARKELQERFMIEEYESNGINSLLITNTQQKKKYFPIILNAHLDVVEGAEKQFAVFEKDGKLYGRGAYDMKAAAAVMIELFKSLAHIVDYPLALQLVTDEEVSGRNGTNFQVNQGVRGDFVIVGEGTNFNIINSCKGRINIRLSTYGKAAHGAYVWKGENAIREMLEIIETLEKTFPTPTSESWTTTINLAKLETTNIEFNQVPVDCTAWLDIRYIPDEKDTILEKIKAHIPHDAHLEIIATSNPHATDQQNKYIEILKNTIRSETSYQTVLAAAHGGSDLNFFTDVGVPGIEFGPVGQGNHSAEEWVDIQSLDNYYNVLKSFLLSLS